MNARRRRSWGPQCRCPWCGRWSPSFPYSWMCSWWLLMHRHAKYDWLRVD